jgi:hypothetical protein
MSWFATNWIGEMLLKELGHLMYLLKIDEHIKFVDFKGNDFNDLTFPNTNAHSWNGDVLINLNVLDSWYNGTDNTMYAISYVDICWTILTKMFPILWMQMFASIFLSLHLRIMAFNYFCHGFINLC